jgi:hypothetical protein
MLCRRSGSELTLGPTLAPVCAPLMGPPTLEGRGTPAQVHFLVPPQFVFAALQRETCMAWLRVEWLRRHYCLTMRAKKSAVCSRVLVQLKRRETRLDAHMHVRWLEEARTAAPYIVRTYRVWHVHMVTFEGWMLPCGNDMIRRHTGPVRRRDPAGYFSCLAPNTAVLGE